MRSVRLAAAILAAVFALSGVACGKKKSHAAHGTAATPAPAPPTPDTTPIARLRTPAGWLLLKPEHSAATPTPAAAPAGNSKS
ncbi:MAG TPA: hypothetical protein VMQ61_03140 [Thermoanaerobaculia bacterium]|nr:hypothetical protein [Thermoanaerobaculia bacterium]